MKYILGILSIVLIAEISFGASITRSKREVDITVVMKDVTAMFQNTCELVLKDLPDTATYAKHKEAIEEFLKFYDDHNLPCVGKMINIFQTHSEMLSKFRADKTAEGEAVRLLFKEHLAKDFFEKYGNLKQILRENNIDIPSKMAQPC